MTSDKTGLTPNYKQNILISINALIDIDIGLFSLIKDEFLDPNVFNVDFFIQSDTLKFISTTYLRLDENPLYNVSILKDHNLLDEYYVQFITDMYNDIYDRSMYTDVLKLLNMFCSTGELTTSILYYKDYSFDMLQKDIESGVLPNNISLVDAKTLKGRDLDKFNQIYLRSIHEFDMLPFNSFTTPKNFYISSFGPNYDHKGLLKRNKSLSSIMFGKLMHDITIFDMYNLNNLKRS